MIRISHLWNFAAFWLNPVLEMTYLYPDGKSMTGTLIGDLKITNDDLDMDQIRLTMRNGDNTLQVELLFDGNMANMSGKIRRLDSGTVIGVIDDSGVVLFRSGEEWTWYDLLSQK